MIYGIIFWGNSTGSKGVFQLQKKIIRIITGSKYKTSCTLRFQSLEILTLSSKYILTLIKFFSHNLEIYSCNFTPHGINSSDILQLHKPTANPTLYQKRVHCMSTKIFNGLPEYTPLVVENVLYKLWKSTYLTNPFSHLKNSIMIRYWYEMNPNNVYVRTDF
jgi:hypothetical protein